MADRLFLVHGMGLQAGGWEQPLRSQLGSLFGRHSRLGTGNLDELFQVVPIQYDDIFRGLLDRWQADANAFGRPDEPASPLVTRLTGWLNDAGNDEQQLWTHPVDVLLYRFFPDVRQAVKTRVALQIATELATLKASENWCVVAHSMGTAVTHDALDMLWSGTLPAGAPTGFDPQRRQAQAIVMLANVSRVLQTSSKVYESTVMPGPAGQAGRGCFQYLTAFHRLDPFTWVNPFRPIAWPDATADAKGLYQFLEADHIHEWNIHDGVHYLKHPSVFVPVLRALTFQTAVTKPAEAAAHAEFEPFGPITAAGAVTIKSWLEDRMPTAGADWKALLDLAEWFFAPPQDVSDAGGGP